MQFSNLQIASVLGGKVHGNGAVVPAPGRGPDDLSMSIVPDEAGGYIVEGAGDVAAARIYIDEKMAQAARKSGRFAKTYDNVVGMHSGLAGNGADTDISHISGSQVEPGKDADNTSKIEPDAPADTSTPDWIDKPLADKTDDTTPPITLVAPVDTTPIAVKAPVELAVELADRGWWCSRVRRAIRARWLRSGKRPPPLT
jgi:hypothetical protein